MTDDEMRRYQKHFEVLADALAAPGTTSGEGIASESRPETAIAGEAKGHPANDSSADLRVDLSRTDAPSPADNLMPMHAPDWLWKAMESYLEEAEALEIVWSGIERTFIYIRQLPDTAPGQCPESEEYVWTEEDIAADRDFEAAGWDAEEDE